MKYQTGGLQWHDTCDMIDTRQKDLSNNEQIVFWLRYVDDHLEVYEEVFGLHCRHFCSHHCLCHYFDTLHKSL